jgi:predicted regulator of Ras-like GTPase activity (Roadblock/LC7/MglB family)
MAPRRGWAPLLAFALALSATAGAQTAAERIRGDVVAADGQKLEIKADSGKVVTVTLGDNVRVSARSAADRAAIVNGAFIGTTAVPQPDGTLRASEVHVFPESMRGTGEGHRPMDTGPGNTMTNATVTNVAAAGNTMTNATVAGVTGSSSALRITLKYKEGEKVVVVGDNVPVVMIEPGDKAMLVPGAHVIVTTSRLPDGTLTTDRVTVGKNGLVPPG